MKNHLLSACLCLLLSQSATAESSLPDIKEGLWELSFQSQITALPTPMPSVAYTSEQCLSKKTAADPQTLLQNNHCEISNLNQQADRVTWQMRCQQQGIEMTGDGNVSYQHESFSGTFNMNMQGEGAGAMKITTQTTGRYLGMCK
jgi:hypothetical protein